MMELHAGPVEDLQAGRVESPARLTGEMTEENTISGTIMVRNAPEVRTYQS
jgi:hypothetical protein